MILHRCHSRISSSTLHDVALVVHAFSRWCSNVVALHAEASNLHWRSTFKFRLQEQMLQRADRSSGHLTSRFNTEYVGFCTCTATKCPGNTRNMCFSSHGHFLESPLHKASVSLFKNVIRVIIEIQGPKVQKKNEILQDSQQFAAAAFPPILLWKMKLLLCAWPRGRRRQSG